MISKLGSAELLWSIIDSILNIREDGQQIEIRVAGTPNQFIQTRFYGLNRSQTLPYQGECRGILMCWITQALNLSLNSLDENTS